MPWAFFIPLGVVVITLAAGIVGVVCELAYERGYADACADWRSLPSYAEPVIEAELADDSYRWN